MSRWRGSSIGVLEAREALKPTIKVDKGGNLCVKLDGGAGLGFRIIL